VTMPLTRFATPAWLSRGRGRRVIETSPKIFSVRSVVYRPGLRGAGGAGGRSLGSVVFWAADPAWRDISYARGPRHVRQPENRVAAARGAAYGPLAIAALMCDALDGSHCSAGAVWRGDRPGIRLGAAHVDEDWNIENGG